MKPESKISLATALEEMEHACAHLRAAIAPGAFVRDHLESAAYRMKIALRKCAQVHFEEFAPISANKIDHRGSQGEKDRRIGIDTPEAYQTIAPAETQHDMDHRKAMEVVNDAA